MRLLIRRVTMEMIKGWYIVLTFALALTGVSWKSYSQEKTTVQIKTFDEELRPLPDIEVSLNGGVFVKIGGRGTGFADVLRQDLPPRNVSIKNEKLEPASWNYSKGIVEIIVRKKNWRILTFQVRSGERATPGLPVTYIGKDTLRFMTNAAGEFELPVGNNDPVPGKEQFLIANRSPERITSSEGLQILIMPTGNAVTESKNARREDDSGFRNFDLNNLDSIQSLTVFYAVFRNYPFSTLDEETRRRIDRKLYELINKAQKELPPVNETMVNRISDSTFVSEDIRYLLAQARTEQGTLTDLRESFDEKIALINEKLQGGIGSLDPEQRERVRQDIRNLEGILKENESRFYRNQQDYHSVLHSIKEKFFDVQELETRLHISETQREQEKAEYQRKMLTVFLVALAFAIVIILLVYFSRKLRKKQEELVMANNEITRINENLEVLVHQRTAMLTNAHKELDTFFYRASHDLQGPICSIIGLCHIATQVTTDQDSLELIRRTNNTARSMDRMLRKLKVISEINQPPDPTVVELHTEMALIREGFRDQIRNNGVRLNIECDPSITFMTHRDLLYTALVNLIENAIVYTNLRPGIAPEVTVTADVDQDRLQISVIDNGIGIPCGIRERVWDMFYIGNENSHGNGLGLYVVRKCIHAMGGSISLESEEGSFTRIVFAIPTLTG